MKLFSRILILLLLFSPLSLSAELMKICKEYFNRLEKLHSEKYDLEYDVTIRDLEVSHLIANRLPLIGRLNCFIVWSLRWSSLKCYNQVAHWEDLEFKEND